MNNKELRKRIDADFNQPVNKIEIVGYIIVVIVSGFLVYYFN